MKSPGRSIGKSIWATSKSISCRGSVSPTSSCAIYLQNVGARFCRAQFDRSYSKSSASRTGPASAQVILDDNSRYDVAVRWNEIVLVRDRQDLPFDPARTVDV